MFFVVRTFLFILILIGTAGLIIGDIASNTLCIAQLFPHNIALGFGSGLSICILVISLYKRKSFNQYFILIILVLTSCALSVSAVFNRKNETAQIRLVEDPIYHRYKSEYDKLFAFKQELWAQYKDLVDPTKRKFLLTDGAIASREDANDLDPRLNYLQQQMDDREQYLKRVGSSLNESFQFSVLFLSSNPKVSQIYSSITFLLLGIACPLALSILGSSLARIRADLYIENNNSVSSFNFFGSFTKFTEFSKRLLNSQYTNTVYPVNVTLTPEFNVLLGIIVIKKYLVLYENKQIDSLSKLGELAANKIERKVGPFSKTYVSRIRRGDYDEMLGKNPKLLKKVTSYAKKIC